MRKEIIAKRSLAQLGFCPVKGVTCSLPPHPPGSSCLAILRRPSLVVWFPCLNRVYFKRSVSYLPSNRDIPVTSYKKEQWSLVAGGLWERSPLQPSFCQWEELSVPLPHSLWDPAALPRLWRPGLEDPFPCCRVQGAYCIAPPNWHRASQLQVATRNGGPWLLEVCENSHLPSPHPPGTSSLAMLWRPRLVVSFPLCRVYFKGPVV